MKKILIIDDDIHIGNVLEEALTKEGYGILRAYSGTEALYVLSEGKPDLVLLDLMLPLTAICGYLDLLEREEKSETMERYIEVIRDRTDMLAQLTEELFRYSLILSGERRMARERVFSNLLNNAVKYSGGDLEITLSEMGEITFSNRAPGLNEVQVGKLFDRFYTVEAARKSTGLA